MRLVQLHVLYHENLCGWNSYYTTRTCAVGRTIIPREPGYLDDRCGRGKHVQFVDLERCTLSIISVRDFHQFDRINSVLTILGSS